jgi:hypothetical protein
MPVARGSNGLCISQACCPDDITCVSPAPGCPRPPYSQVPISDPGAAGSLPATPALVNSPIPPSSPATHPFVQLLDPADLGVEACERLPPHHQVHKLHGCMGSPDCKQVLARQAAIISWHPDDSIVITMRRSGCHQVQARFKSAA